MSSIEIIQMLNKGKGFPVTHKNRGHHDLRKKIRHMFQKEISLGKISESGFTNDRGKILPVYLLPEIESKMLVASVDVSYLRQITEFWINKGKIALALPEFTDPAASARAWADEVDLKNDAYIELESLRPKGEALDILEAAPASIELTQAGKILNLKPRKMINRLVENKVLYRTRSGNLSIHQDYANRGYFEIALLYSYEINKSYRGIYVTGAGMIWLIGHTKNFEVAYTENRVTVR
jgi:phage antirepressor YoqD-like protein